MKRKTLVILLMLGFGYSTLYSQKSSDFSAIDILLVRGEYKKVIDTCRIILGHDSLNPEIYYKMGLAYQNILPDDKSFECFQHASAIKPDNNLYKYMVAKGYFNKNKNSQAKPLLQSLCISDSMNWTYAYYLTSIYLQEGRYDESIRIYNRFYAQDTSNYVFIDKIGFANLRKGDTKIATYLFTKSLRINGKNNNAIKNLAYLYTLDNKIKDAISLLSSGIKTDSADMDLYVRRAALYFSTNNNKRALNDYLKILGSGDSAFLYLKRAGIGYSNNLQPEEANKYLLLAIKKDTTDYESLNFIARNYHKQNDLKKSAYYYNKIVKMLSPVSFQLGFTYILLAEELKADGLFKDAITNYLKSQDIRHDVSISMIIANLYDEKLNDSPKAIYYYQQFLDDLKNIKSKYKPDYVESVRNRMEVLKEKQQISEKK